MTDRSIDWTRDEGLIAAIVQDADSGAVLMLGWMNREAYEQTRATGIVTFFSRSRRRLWVKGESSGHYLRLRDMAIDCDGDALLVLAHPDGPACHLNTPTCWGESPPAAALQGLQFLPALERIIEQRMATRPEDSYTSRLLSAGNRRIAQKVGEEGLEVALAAVSQSIPDLIGESADLLFHLLLLLRVKGISLAQVVEELRQRHPVRQAGSNA